MLSKKQEKIILIDSNALIHRAFHALPPFTTRDGRPAGAVYGVALTLLSVIDKFQPEYMAAAFDLKGKTFRHEKFEEYKATRVKAPDELYEQIPLVKEMFKAWGIPVFEKEGFEADDIIGTLCREKSVEDIQSIIVTGDKDTLQLVDDNTSVFALRKGIKDTVVYHAKAVEKSFGYRPDQVVDFKALRGDVSDNIPGVKGVGEKTALDLIKEFGTVKNIYANLDKIKPAVVKKLEAGKELAEMSYELATISVDVPIKFNLVESKFNTKASKELLNFFQEVGFHSLIKRLTGEVSSDNESFGNKSKTEATLEIEVIKNEKKLKELIQNIQVAKKFSFEVLWEGDDFFSSQLLGVGVATASNKGYFIPQELVGELEFIFRDNEIQKIGFNIKEGWKILAKFFYTKNTETGLMEKIYSDFDLGNFFDTQLALYALEGTAVDDLGRVILRYLGDNLQWTEQKAGQGNLLFATAENQQNSVVEKATKLLILADKLSVDLEKEDEIKNSVWKKMEVPLVMILAKMEIAGIKTDVKKLNSIAQLAQEELKDLEQQIYNLAGEKFNINSPSQLAPILFEKLKISAVGIRRGKTHLSTSAEELQKIRDLHPIVSLIEEYRELAKVKNTYVDVLPNLLQMDGRIHAKFNQAVTSTGRLSSSEPNMQNIPKRGRLAGEIRKAFIAEKGRVLLSADYSQIDLRVAAHLSSDPKMIVVFQENKDIHRATAAWVNSITESAVTEKMRNEAKALNFGILYGMGIYGFMRDSGVSMERARFFMEHYKKTYGRLMEFIEETKNFARKNGYAETELGRRRYISEINVTNSQMRLAAERMAINLPVQGLSADIMKLAMIAVEKEILQKYNKSNTKPVAFLTAQIHDEIILEVQEELADKLMQELKVVMESVYQMKVPLAVDVSRGSNWDEL
ncbi:MAG TPA: DNA polymerase I [Candidatus Moranbacteria bacterium]|nr:DNA polymerase I [Candidatus Moranbacteria bacterium]